MPKPPPLQPLAHPVGVLYEIRWSEICPWLILFKALRVTLLVRVLVLALLGMLLTSWGSVAIDGWFADDAPLVAQQPRTDPACNLVRFPLPPDHPVNQLLAYAARPPLLRGWSELTYPFYAIFDRDQTWQATLTLLARGCWVLAIWGIFGGAIARIAALYTTRGEIISPSVALRDAITVWPSTTGGPMIAGLLGCAVGVPLVVLSLLLRLEIGATLVGVLWILVLAHGLLLAIIFLGLMIGWPLLWACQAVERSDAFDCVSRGAAYVYQKPLQLTVYVLIAASLTLLSEAVVVLFADTSVKLSEWALSWGMGGTRANELFGSESQVAVSSFAARAISRWESVIRALGASVPVACLWSMSVGIYLLMRRHVDSTEMDEVTLSDGTKQAGLPKLQEKESGVPEVEQPATNGDVQKNEE